MRDRRAARLAHEPHAYPAGALPEGIRPALKDIAYSLSDLCVFEPAGEGSDSREAAIGVWTRIRHDDLIGI